MLTFYLLIVPYLEPCDAAYQSIASLQHPMLMPNFVSLHVGTPLWKLILKQFDDLLVKILIAAAIISFFLALVNGETGLTAFLEPSVSKTILLHFALCCVCLKLLCAWVMFPCMAYHSLWSLRQHKWFFYYIIYNKKKKKNVPHRIS